jgi:hypothetical protein
MKKWLTITFWQERWLSAVLLGAILLMLISLIIRALIPPAAPEPLQPLLEPDNIKVGDPASVLDNLTNSQLEQTLLEEVAIYSYHSLKNANLVKNFRVTDGKIRTIEYPLTSQERLLADSFTRQLKQTNYSEYVDKEPDGQPYLYRIFPDIGVAIHYHFSSGGIDSVVLFKAGLPNNMIQYYPELQAFTGEEQFYQEEVDADSPGHGNFPDDIFAPPEEESQP